MNEYDTILIIDDEVQIRRLLEISLTSSGYKTIFASDGKGGIASAVSHSPSLIILDLGLPDIDGIDLLVKLREWFTKPIIVLTVRNSEDDIISALDKGANDYLTKPFRSGELLARVRTAIKLITEKANVPLMIFGSLSIDLVNHIVKKNNEVVKLTVTEFSLISILAKNHGRVLTHQFLLKEIWGYGYLEQTQYLRVFMAQLRKKIEDDPSRPEILITESGIGYRFKD
jgi:two-component system KDP operon response regulator KdpE